MLTVKNLKTSFRTDEGEVRAVDKVSFRVNKGELFAMVGESGCGKSITALSIMRLISCPPGRIAADAITLDGTDLLSLPERRMREVRGGRISMVFQEPMSSLNPVFTCGSQIMEAIELHRGLGGKAARDLAVTMLGRVGIPDPGKRFGEYPHQMSGGMQQRVMIAMALSCNPKLLIADEPTTALDVTIQAQILDLIKELQRREQLSILLITHDLGVVAEVADRVGVMYASRLCEIADAAPLFEKPLHPYTKSLFKSLPRLGMKKERLETIPGTVPNPLEFPSGCTFHPRCFLTRQRAAAAGSSGTVTVESAGEQVSVLRQCAHAMPPLREIEPGHWCSCWECEGFEGAKESDPAGEGEND
ncbi:MAG: ABC transporter ATP-binding protein [Chitinispirillaceae bacterium]|nr:ABC transporter ATP-binding protein [Chitinispirillaceae bacterium]